MTTSPHPSPYTHLTHRLGPQSHQHPPSGSPLLPNPLPPSTGEDLTVGCGPPVPWGPRVTRSLRWLCQKWGLSSSPLLCGSVLSTHKGNKQWQQKSLKRSLLLSSQRPMWGWHPVGAASGGESKPRAAPNPSLSLEYFYPPDVFPLLCEKRNNRTSLIRMLWD